MKVNPVNSAEKKTIMSEIRLDNRTVGVYHVDELEFFLFGSIAGF